MGVDARFAFLDALIVLTSYLGMLVLRFDGAVPDTYWRRFLTFLPLALVAHLGSSWAWGLYRHLWRHAGVQEARRVLLVGGWAAMLLAAPYFALGRPVPLSVAMMGVLVTTLLMGAVRFQSRLLTAYPRGGERPGLRVVVVGAGEAGAAIVREMQRSANGFTPVAVVDDDPRKQGLSLLGVRVVGGVDTLVEVVATEDAHRVLLAVPSADQRFVRRVADAAATADVPMLVVPELSELIQGRVTMRDVRDLQIEDLIGRQEVKVDLDSVRRLVAGRRVLITGGGGSIGGEIARQVAACDPGQLILVDNDETHLHDTVSRLEGGATSVLADVRDAQPIRRAFRLHRPEIVFHAAAHKHVPILEDHPCEAVATNLLGTAHVVDAATEIGVERLVFISTDKAVQPASVMGASKWFGEQLVIARAPVGSRWCAVRFGNVLGSRGSVVPTFSRQIAGGGPVTVTDERMTRYFMSIEEAVKLVLQAAVFADGGEVFMLEMGEAVNILDLARRMIRLSGYRVGADIDIEIVGRRAGEKLFERLHTSDEPRSPTAHEAIFRVGPVRLATGRLEESLVYFADAAARHDDAAARRLVDVAAGGHPQPHSRVDADVDLVTMERSGSWSRSNT